MEISIRWFSGQYPSFNVGLASKPGNDPFLEIKSCRLVKGKDGEFVSWPSTKNEKTQKYWNHVYASKEFAEVVLKKAKESQPQESAPKAKAVADDIDSDFIPF